MHVVEAQDGHDGAKWVTSTIQLLISATHTFVWDTVYVQTRTNLLLLFRYIFNPRFRIALATIWKKPEVQHWWLPNDEGYSSLIREIRKMTDERTTQPRDDFRENVRDMKGMFWKLNIDDAEDEQSPSSSHNSFQ